MYRFKFTVFNHKVDIQLTMMDVVCTIASVAMTIGSFVLYLLPMLR